MTNKELVEKFYRSFSNGNVESMLSCYHKEITFQDPAFGELKGDRAVKMWEMLLSKRTDKTKISVANIQVSDEIGTATWTAKYIFGEKKRQVTNVVSAKFKFKEGKIIEHIDSFNVWNWSRQALGTVGLFMGWTSFMENKIQKTTNKQLDDFINRG